MSAPPLTAAPPKERIMSLPPSRRVVRLIAPALLAAIVVSTPAGAQDWPQWRGPQRDGVVSAGVAPASWPADLTRRWQVEVGEGHASPVVAGRRVIVHTRRTDRETVSSIDLGTGKVAWADAYDAPYTMNRVATAHGKGPKSTPVVAAGRVYTLGITEILSCYDLDNGRLLWRKDFSTKFPATSPDFGTAMSPLVDRGLLIVHVGTSGRGALMALDAVSGDLEWRWTGDGPAYASPIAVDLAGTRQIVTQSQSRIVSVAADTGTLLWSVPFTTPYVQNIVTPLVVNDALVFSGLDAGVVAVRPVRSGSTWSVEQVWKSDAVSMYMNSPVLEGNLVFGFSHKNRGQFFCLDAATGKTLWLGDGRQGENAAMLVAGEFVVSLTNDASLIVSKASAAGLQPVRTYKAADSPTWAHPVLVRGGVLVKDATMLTLWGWE
jgi:outer membrane protein assembly factor BamB